MNTNTNDTDFPSNEEFDAYVRGELSAADAERVKKAIAENPELERLLMDPFPTEEEAGTLTDEEFEPRWAELQRRLALRRRVVPINRFYRTALPIAAALVVTFAALFVQAQVRARRLASELAAPKLAWEEQVLLPDGQRGPQSIATVTAQGDSYLLVATLIHVPEFQDYRLELVDIATPSPRSLWKSGIVRHHNNDSFAILVPRSFLGAGKYQIVLTGVSGAREERLATYSLRVPRHQDI